MKLSLYIGLLAYIGFSTVFANTFDAEIHRAQALIASDSSRRLYEEIKKIEDMEIYFSLCNKQIEAKVIPWGCYVFRSKYEKSFNNSISLLNDAGLRQSCLEGVARAERGLDLPPDWSAGELHQDCFKQLEQKRRQIKYKEGVGRVFDSSP